MVAIQKMKFSTSEGGDKNEIMEMTDADQWEDFLMSDKPVILQAGASWCGPCNILKPILKGYQK